MPEHGCFYHVHKPNRVGDLRRSPCLDQVLLRPQSPCPQFCPVSALGLTLSPTCSAQSASAPTVDRVEPPNWWTGSTVNPLRVLLHGSGLAGAQVQGGDGLKVSNIKVTDGGHYLFADVSIDSGAALGVRTLTVTTAQGATHARFEVDKPLPAAGRFQGWSPDDVVYLIMPDRFADGDTDNDDPAISKGEYDRSNPHMYHGGDFQGIIDHLPYLKDLGVTAIWINPVYDNYNTPYPNHQADYHGYGRGEPVRRRGALRHSGKAARDGGQGARAGHQGNPGPGR